MRILVVTLTFNEEVIIPFFLRHYERFASRILVCDSGSTDRTVEIARAHRLVRMIPREPTGGEINDTENARIKNESWRGLPADWVMLVDTDEFLYHPIMRAFLDDCDREGKNAVRSECWQMVGDSVPTEGLITDHIKTGVRDHHTQEFYDKTLIFKPSANPMFGVGCHDIAGPQVRISEKRVKLLHYKWLSAEYVQTKADAIKISEVNRSKGHGLMFHRPVREVWPEYYRDAFPRRQRLNFLP